MKRGFCALLILTFACDNNGGNSAPQLKSNIGIDMGTVKGFVLATPSSPGRQTGNPGQVTYAINADNSLTRISVTTDDEGNSSSNSMSYTPHAIFDTPKFVLFAFQDLKLAAPQGPDYTCQTVVLRRDDGALFCSPRRSQGGRVVTDGGGDLLFLQNVSTIEKIDMSDPSNPFESNVIENTSQTQVRALAVNERGDAFAAFSEMGDRARVFKREGGLQNISTSYIECITRDLASEPESFLYIARANDGAELHRLARQADGSYEDTSLATVMPQTAGSGGSCTPALRNATRVIALVTTQQAGALVELVGPNGTMQAIPISSLPGITQAFADGERVFVLGTDAAGNSGVVRYTPSSGEQTVLLAPGDYTLSSIALTPGGELGFAGLRNSDGKRVLGAVPASGGAAAIWSETAPEISTLVRLR